MYAYQCEAPVLFPHTWLSEEKNLTRSRPRNLYWKRYWEVGRERWEEVKERRKVRETCGMRKMSGKEGRGSETSFSPVDDHSFLNTPSSLSSFSFDFSPLSLLVSFLSSVLQKSTKQSTHLITSHENTRKHKFPLTSNWVRMGFRNRVKRTRVKNCLWR